MVFFFWLLYQSTRSRRLSSDDVDAVGRLPILNDTHYRDILCEIGGMFSIANGIDDIHKGPWIGFQSWRAAGRKVFICIIESSYICRPILSKLADKKFDISCMSPF